ncbi:MAG: hypothetical protein N3F04_02245 [Candidatus Nezhaarchaeota archaeon]|nr:hypothetical protein [Candidatus Nezhaarchaeota archaeon]MCX8141598.1 hypothetical protein [Candidatus Nezhaarchaeota archaeon]MDW8049865.1 hypothetical protein [Nitrososphaerota archaeon]
MAQVIEEVLNLHYKPTFLHSYNVIYLKVTLIILALLSRIISPYFMFTVLIINSSLLIYAGAKRVLLTVSALWSLLTSIIVVIDLAFSTLTMMVVYNLIHGFTTFTALTLFYVTTPPKHIRKLLGFNMISTAYMLFGYSLKLIRDLIDVMRARGWEYTLSPQRHQYILRAFTVLLVTRISESIEALKARGFEE